MHNGLKGKKILITSGPTSVEIDEMRVITNRSIGEMGRLLANACAKAGGRVTLLEGAVTTAVPLVKGIKVLRFFLFDELARLLTAQLKMHPDIVLHAAAVSDFRLKKIFKGKVASCDQMILELVATKKLINTIKELASQTILVGFKFESSLKAAIKGAKVLFLNAGCDLVVANSQNVDGYQARLLCCDGLAKKIFTTKNEVVRHLIEQIAL